MRTTLIRSLLLAAAILAVSAASFAQISISVNFGPPALPVYQQPPCPGEDYIWTPGYWAWDPADGYYWVPGTWVLAPEPGLLWTPGYWAFDNGLFNSSSTRRKSWRCSGEKSGGVEELMGSGLASRDIETWMAGAASLLPLVADNQAGDGRRATQSRPPPAPSGWATTSAGSSGCPAAAIGSGS